MLFTYDVRGVFKSADPILVKNHWNNDANGSDFRGCYISEAQSFSILINYF